MGADRLPRDARHFRPRDVERLRRFRRPGPEPDDLRRPVASGRDVAVDAVGEAALLPHPEEEARVRPAAQDVAGDHEGEVVGLVLADGPPAHGDGRLTQGARDRRRLGRRRRGPGRDGRGRRRRSRPVAAAGEDLLPRLVQRDGADDRDDRGVGADVLGVVPDDLLAREPADRLAGPVRRVPVRVTEVDEPHELASRHRLRIFLRALDPRLDLLPRPRELGLRKGRAADDVGEEVEPEREVLLEHRQRDRDAVPARVRLEAPPDELDGAVDVGARAGGRAAREEPGGEGRQARQVGRVEGAARAEVGAHGNDGHRGPLRHQQDDPVRQDLPARERGRGRRPGQDEQEGQQGHPAHRPHGSHHIPHGKPTRQDLHSIS